MSDQEFIAPRLADRVRRPFLESRDVLLRECNSIGLHVDLEAGALELHIRGMLDGELVIIRAGVEAFVAAALRDELHEQLRVHRAKLEARRAELDAAPRRDPKRAVKTVVIARGAKRSAPKKTKKSR